MTNQRMAATVGETPMFFPLNFHPKSFPVFLLTNPMGKMEMEKTTIHSVPKRPFSLPKHLLFKWLFRCSFNNFTAALLFLDRFMGIVFKTIQFCIVFTYSEPFWFRVLVHLHLLHLFLKGRVCTENNKINEIKSWVVLMLYWTPIKWVVLSLKNVLQYAVILIFFPVLCFSAVLHPTLSCGERDLKWFTNGIK